MRVGLDITGSPCSLKVAEPTWFKSGVTRKVISFLIQTAVVLALIYFIPWLGEITGESRLMAAKVAAVLMSGFFSFVWEVMKARYAASANPGAT